MKLSNQAACLWNPYLLLCSPLLSSALIWCPLLSSPLSSGLLSSFLCSPLLFSLLSSSLLSSFLSCPLLFSSMLYFKRMYLILYLNILNMIQIYTKHQHNKSAQSTNTTNQHKGPTHQISTKQQHNKSAQNVAGSFVNQILSKVLIFLIGLNVWICLNRGLWVWVFDLFECLNRGLWVWMFDLFECLNYSNMRL